MSAAIGCVDPDDAITVAAARLLRPGQVCFVGIGLPSAAAMLARATTAPDLVLVYESGVLGAKPTYVPLSVADAILAKTAVDVVSVPELFNYWLQPGRIDVGLIGAGQVDRMGNINSTAIGDYAHPSIRLPGAGGAPEIGAACAAFVVLVRQSLRSFVGKVDFVSTVGHGAGPGDRARLGLPGAGPVAVITDLGVYAPDPLSCELRLTALQPGVSVDDARAATGWNLAVAPDLAMLAPPTQAELDILRGFPAAGGAGR
jgi:glutaconate CoA-transferase, subunit B